MPELEITKVRQWGFERINFEVEGWQGFVIMPPRPVRPKNIPWVWYAPTFKESPFPLPKDLHRWYMEQWLKDGIAIGGVDVGESWGSPEGREIYTRFHDIVVREFLLDFKACLLPQSRGSLMHYNWAVEHPDRVRCIAAIYPVCEISEPQRTERICHAYGLSPEELLAQRDRHNPIDRLAPLAKLKVPIFHIHGDKDDIVPLDKHSRVLIDRYQKLGGPGELMVLPGQAHEEVDAFFKCPAFLNYVRTQALA